MFVKDLADLAHVDRGQLAKWEKGEVTVRDATALAVERALDRFEEEVSGPYDDTESNVVTFRLKGNFGVDVTLAGPVDNLPELEASVTRLLRSMGDPSGSGLQPDVD
jgi:transcriptional regulator with XRE-family HTH domain